MFAQLVDVHEQEQMSRFLREIEGADVTSTPPQLHYDNTSFSTPMFFFRKHVWNMSKKVAKKVFKS